MSTDSRMTGETPLRHIRLSKATGVPVDSDICYLRGVLTLRQLPWEVGRGCREGSVI